MTDYDLVRRCDVLEILDYEGSLGRTRKLVEQLVAVTPEAQAAEIESLLGDLAKAQDQIKAQAAEIERLRLLVPRPDQTQDELVWRDHMRGVPLAALAKEFGVTKERMRYRLKKIAENKLHLTGNQP